MLLFAHGAVQSSISCAREASFSFSFISPTSSPLDLFNSSQSSPSSPLLRENSRHHSTYLTSRLNRGILTSNSLHTYLVFVHSLEAFQRVNLLFISGLRLPCSIYVVLLRSKSIIASADISSVFPNYFVASTPRHLCTPRIEAVFSTTIFSLPSSRLPADFAHHVFI